MRHRWDRAFTADRMKKAQKTSKNCHSLGATVVRVLLEACAAVKRENPACVSESSVGWVDCRSCLIGYARGARRARLAELGRGGSQWQRGRELRLGWSSVVGERGRLESECLCGRQCADFRRPTPIHNRMEIWPRLRHLFGCCFRQNRLATVVLMAPIRSQERGR